MTITSYVFSYVVVGGFFTFTLVVAELGYGGGTDPP